MNKIISIIVVFALITLVACDQDDINSTLSDTLYVKSEGNNMPAYIYGNGASKVFIILVHGGPGGNGYEYRSGSYAEDLEEKYAMVYWDQRGQGMSQGHPDESELTIAQMVNDLEKLILVIKAKYGDDISCFMLGHSWGGTLGTAFMIDAERQKMVKGWIESNGAHDVPKLYTEAVKLFIKTSNEQIALGNSVSKWQDILDWASAIDTNNITYDQTGELNQKGFEVEAILAEDGFISEGQYLGSGIYTPINPLTNLITGNATNGALEAEVEAASMTDQLHKITVPSLFLWGKYDFVVPPQLGVDAYNLVSSTKKKLVIFEKSGHSPMDNEADAFVAAVVEFVEENK